MWPPEQLPISLPILYGNLKKNIDNASVGFNLGNLNDHGPYSEDAVYLVECAVYQFFATLCVLLALRFSVWNLGFDFIVSARSLSLLFILLPRHSFRLIDLRWVIKAVGLLYGLVGRGKDAELLFAVGALNVRAKSNLSRLINTICNTI